MRRFHCEGLAQAKDGDHLTLSDETRRHVRVLRLEAGAEVLLFDGEGHLAHAALTDEGVKVATITSVPPVRPALHLILGMPKRTKVDGIVRMATEIGAASVRMVRVARSVAAAEEKKRARLARVVREACRQSERLHGMQLHFHSVLKEAIDALPNECSRYVAWARSHERVVPTGDERCIAVGPEGGFTDGELARLQEAGFKHLSLSATILRTETAAIVALARLAL
ncbi:MAG: RsmE family RNA methyltransferase [Myxococcota bacterium]